MFERLEMLFSPLLLENFYDTKILLVGVGGVGGACFEALVRMGIKNITIIDGDTFSISNLNRQLLSNINNIGHSKVKEAYLRAKSINHSINVNYYELFLNEANIDLLSDMEYDYIIDCCDTITTKLLLIKIALNNKVRIISCMGTGNRVDPTKLEITNIWNTSYDPLARIMRKLLREAKISDKIMVLCSNEKPIHIESREPGSTAFVPNVAGFIIASYVFNDIINDGK